MLKFALVYDRSGPNIKSLPLPPLFRPRYNYAGAVISDGEGDTILVHGGFNCGCLDDSDSFLRVQLSDLQRNHPISASRLKLTGAVPCPRQLHAMCAVGSRTALIFGGRDRNYGALADVYSVSLQTGACSKQRAALPFPLEGHAAICVSHRDPSAPSPSGLAQRILVIGGETNREGYEALTRLRGEFLGLEVEDGGERGGKSGQSGSAVPGEPKGQHRPDHTSGPATTTSTGQKSLAGLSARRSSLETLKSAPALPTLAQKKGQLGDTSLQLGAQQARQVNQMSQTQQMRPTPQVHTYTPMAGASAKGRVFPSSPVSAGASAPSRAQAKTEWLSDLILEYNMDTKEFRVVGVLPYPVSGHAVVSAPDRTGDARVLIVCGKTPIGAAATAVEYFPRSGKVAVRRLGRETQEAPGSGFPGRVGCGAAVSSGALYVFGGKGDDHSGNQTLGDLWEFQIDG